ncbi:hypothetical protein D3C72_1114980 [compost metagenome]
MRLGQAEAADQFAARHRRQPLPALFFTAVRVDGIHAQRALHRHEAAQPRITALQLLADQPVTDRAKVAAAVLGRQRRAEQTQRSDLRHQLRREPRLVEGIADDRQHALVGEAGHALLYRALFLAEQGTDIEQVVRIQSHGTHTQSGPGHCRSSRWVWCAGRGRPWSALVFPRPPTKVGGYRSHVRCIAAIAV